MTPSPDELPDDGDGILAAEYALGVLSADERQAAAARMDSEPAFARLVEQWEAHLAPMDDFAPVEPPRSVKQKLDARLFADGADRANARSATRAGLWGSLWFWRGLAAAALIAAGAFVAVPYLFAPAPTDTGIARFVASLAPQQSNVHYFVVYDARENDIGLSHVTGERTSGSDFELWVIEGDRPPASLGVIPEGSSVHLAVDDRMRRLIDAGAVFAISAEPRGGSPTGLPTGPVVAAGDLRAI